MGGIAGRRGRNPVGIFLHNDAAGNGATAGYYRRWLPGHNAENGFAHYYVCSDGIVQAEEDYNMAWHCGQADGNANYLSIEICQSMGNLDTFRANEEKALQLAAQKCKQYGIPVNGNTIRLHQEVFATACPHRSVEIHGGRAATKQYFINRINELIAGSQTGWIKDNVGWWYRHTDGSYTKNDWELIGGEWYYFNEKGYAVENQWILWKDTWYYLGENCKMATGWIQYNGNWYHLDGNGAMSKGWLGYNDKWYYLNPGDRKDAPEGAMLTRLREIDGKLYHFDGSGAMEWEIDMKGSTLKATGENKWEIVPPKCQEKDEQKKKD